MMILMTGRSFDHSRAMKEELGLMVLAQIAKAEGHQYRSFGIIKSTVQRRELHVSCLVDTMLIQGYQ